MPLGTMCIRTSIPPEAVTSIVEFDGNPRAAFWWLTTVSTSPLSRGPPMPDPHHWWRKSEDRASTTTACTRSSPTSAAADLDDTDERVRAVRLYAVQGPTPKP